MRFTVFTPTYNRGYILEPLYRSLQRQTFQDFEWVIIDDGSTDNTEEIVRRMQQEDNFFPIIYRKVPNGGKHRAFNQAAKLAAGELLICVDSDDYLTDDALEIADHIEKSIPADEKNNFAGICGLRGTPDQKMIGSTFHTGYHLDMTHIERMQNKVSGDKTEIIYTSVWLTYPFHEFEGENFLTEATALNRMAADGLKIRYFNEIIKITEYLPDGLTRNSLDRFRSNPKGYGLYIHQQIQYGLLKGREKWKAIANYYNQCYSRIDLNAIAENLYMTPIQVKTIAFLVSRYWQLEELIKR